MLKTAFFIIFSLVLITDFSVAKVKVVPTVENIYINKNEHSAPIGFSRLVFNVPSTKKLGTGGFKHLLGCIKKYPYELESNTFNIENRIFINSFTEIMKQANYNIPGDPNSLFADKKIEPEFLIAAMISDFEIDYCHGTESSSGDGQLYMNLDWQVYNIAKEEVVFRKQTEGYYKIKKWSSNIVFRLLENTFKSALHNFLETDELATVLAGGDRGLISPDFDQFNVNYIQHEIGSPAVSIVQARQSVVTINLPTGGHGSGFLISDNGYILTNEHVVGLNDSVTITFDNGIAIEGQVVRTAPLRDVALVKVPLSRSKPLRLKIDEPEVGSSVYTIGSPLDPDLSGTVSQGIISAFRMIDNQEYIQSDAQINGGNSGGPMIDENGNVVAISVAGRIDGEGINFFIPIRFALEALNIQKITLQEKRYSDGSE